MSQKTRYSIRGMFHLLSDKNKNLSDASRHLQAHEHVTSQKRTISEPKMKKRNRESCLSNQKAMLEIGYRKKDELI